MRTLCILWRAMARPRQQASWPLVITILLSGDFCAPVDAQQPAPSGGPGVTIQADPAGGSQPAPSPPPTSVQLQKRTFAVPMGFFVSTGVKGTENDGMGDLGQDVLRSALEAKGLSFPPGAAAAFLPATRKLVVVDTPDQLDSLARLIQAAGNDTVPSGGRAVASLPAAGGPVVIQAPGGESSALPTDAISGSAGIQKKLNSMILSAYLNNATLAEAVRYLSVKSKNLDPDQKGIQFVLSPSLITNDQPQVRISLQLDNIPMVEILHYIALQANVTYTIKDDGVYFSPK